MLKKPNSFFFYKVLTWLIAPLLPFIWESRLKANKEIKATKSQRFGEIAIQNKNNIIWIHCASVGETTIGINIARELNKKNPNQQFFFTAQTVAAKNLFEKANLENAIFQFAPFDSPKIAKTFVEKLMPKLAIFIEGEIWPNLIDNLDENKIPRIYINARLTQKSIIKWQKTPKFAQMLFGNFCFIHAANSQTANALEKLSNKKIENIGNLKFATPKLYENLKLINKIKNETNGRKIWLAASSHEGEEEIIIKAHKKIIEKYKNSLLIIAPRHINRDVNIAQIAQSHNLKYQFKSENHSIDDSTNIFIWNSIGELGSAFKIAHTCFIAGSLLPKIGGHNPIEPAQLNCPIITGPFFHNFDDIFNAMIENNCVIKCENPNDDEIAKAVNNIFEDNQYSQKLSHNAMEFIADKTHNMVLIIEKIKDIIDAKP